MTQEKVKWEYYDLKYDRWLTLRISNWITGIQDEFVEDEAKELYEAHKNVLHFHDPEKSKAFKLRRLGAEN